MACRSHCTNVRTTDRAWHVGREYDDVIVGAGSVGCVLAARLSEDPTRRVLLIEAGPDYATADQTPRDLLDGTSMSLTEHDWCLTADVSGGRVIKFPRGKVTGGSSAVGATVALRGVPADYDGWAALGNSDWGWADVLPWFRRLEDDADFGGEFHGRGGPVPVCRLRSEELSAVQHAFLDTCLEAGFPIVADHNDPAATGVGVIPSNRRGSTRVSAAMAYLNPVRHRKNLQIRAGELVDRVLFDGDRASGVAVRGGVGTESVPASRVVLCAGAISTPAILLRSGIGPREDLRSLGIDVRVDAPGVGENLVDHPRTGVFVVPRPDAWRRSDPFVQVLLRTAGHGSDELNDMQYYLLGHFDLTPFPALLELAGASVILGVMAVAQRPRSRGSVRLVGSDPRVPPRISLNFLSAESDLRVLIDGIRTCWDLLSAEAVAKHGERTVVLTKDMVRSDDALEFYLRLSVDSAYHPVGTARMGPVGDADAVVGQRGRVRGVDGLYVADASIMPTIVRANTNLTCIMIGERMADWLLEGS
jgi:choline dehydrogenase